MEEKIIQITSGKGPDECERVVALILQELLTYLKSNNIDFDFLEQIKGKHEETFLSVILKVKSANFDALEKEWQGTIQWISVSPFRKFHKRKNWFVGLSFYSVLKEQNLNKNEISYQTMRSSGAGGQNVNKVETAVRAIHLKSGISVVVSNSRSQLQNKKNALLLIQYKLFEKEMEIKGEQEKQQWMNHHNLSRGNPIKIFKRKMD